MANEMLPTSNWQQNIASSLGVIPEDINAVHPLLREATRGAYSGARTRPLNLANDVMDTYQKALASKQAFGAESARSAKLAGLKNKLSDLDEYDKMAQLASGMELSPNEAQKMKDMGLWDKYQQTQRRGIQEKLDGVKSKIAESLTKRGRDAMSLFIQGAMDIDDYVSEGVPAHTIYNKIDEVEGLDDEVKRSLYKYATESSVYPTEADEPKPNWWQKILGIYK